MTRARRGPVTGGVLRLLVALALVAGGAVAVSAPGPAAAQANPYQRGPAPTSASIEADGTFAVAEAQVPRQAGFGGATIYYPTDASQTYGGIVMTPGFTETRSHLAWIARRVATHGFVVINIDTLDTLVAPNGRADQMLAALDYLVDTSTVRSRVDGTRLGAAGHSMGGGGTIEAASKRPSLKAGVAFQPWHSNTAWQGVRVPIMIQGADGDIIAPVAQHSEVFYQNLASAPEKAYAEFNNADHFVSGANGNRPTSRFTVSWFKRFVDNDTRYDQFLCPAPAAGATLDEYRATCPHSGTPGTTTTTRPGGTTTTTRPTTTTTAPPAECQWWEFWCWLGWT